MVTYYAKLTSKGQLTLPAELRRRMRFEIGETLAFDLAEDGHLAVRSPRQVLEANFGTWSLPEGMTVQDAVRIAREEMQEEAVERYLRATES